MPSVPIQPAPGTSGNMTFQEAHYSYPAPAGSHAGAQFYAPQQPHQQQLREFQPHEPHDHPYSYGHEGYSSSSINNNNNFQRYDYNNINNDDLEDQDHDSQSSKQTSPAPSSTHGNDNSSRSNVHNTGSDAEAANDEGQGPNKHTKGKLFQCTGFGDCRMVFTRSEHLARHARKHTGEKPFQCVVEGCTRMFSRFDNMVQHTQTHTKGPDGESSVEIAAKIATESRRKSEAGLLGGGTVGRRSSIKGPKAATAKRGSISSASGPNVTQKARRDRMQSMPMLNMTAASDAQHRSSTPVLPSPVTPSSSSTSPLSPKKQQRSRASKTIGRGEGGRIQKKMQGATRDRRGSLESSTMGSPPAESWYASKLHHRPSLDYGLDQRAFFANSEKRPDSGYYQQLPPLSAPHANQGYPVNQDMRSFSRTRHPMSPELSSNSDFDSDDAGYYISQQPPHRRSGEYGPGPVHPLDPRMDSSMDSCTLPPLRSSPETQPPRLPSISHGRLRSQSIHHFSGGPHYVSQPYPTSKTRRLSLVELNAPIQEATKAVHHSMQVDSTHDPLDNHGGRGGPGVDVSEDEIKALEAFGELWSQGRDIEMTERDERRSTTPQIKSEMTVYEPAHVPGPDFGRREYEARGHQPYRDVPMAMDHH
ncbi:hypothetical protein BGZ72_001041 [Mortierella alpina]|nr:hypothetical protein BGZ72_001041 [Mortierella alpina]